MRLGAWSVRTSTASLLRQPSFSGIVSPLERAGVEPDTPNMLLQCARRCSWSSSFCLGAGGRSLQAGVAAAAGGRAVCHRHQSSLASGEIRASDGVAGAISPIIGRKSAPEWICCTEASRAREKWARWRRSRSWRSRCWSPAPSASNLPTFWTFSLRRFLHSRPTATPRCRAVSAFPRRPFP